ncbi:MAG: hypothetical protein ACYTDX_09490 [Planctomycetota bacterium]
MTASAYQRSGPRDRSQASRDSSTSAVDAGSARALIQATASTCAGCTAKTKPASAAAGKRSPTPRTRRTTSAAFSAWNSNETAWKPVAPNPRTSLSTAKESVRSGR